MKNFFVMIVGVGAALAAQAKGPDSPYVDFKGQLNLECQLSTRTYASSTKLSLDAQAQLVAIDHVVYYDIDPLRPDSFRYVLSPQNDVGGQITSVAMVQDTTTLYVNGHQEIYYNKRVPQILSSVTLQIEKVDSAIQDYRVTEIVIDGHRIGNIGFCRVAEAL